MSKLIIGLLIALSAFAVLVIYSALIVASKADDEMGYD